MSIEQHIDKLRESTPEKCQDCECHQADFIGNAGWVWICETAPNCYKESTVGKKELKCDKSKEPPCHLEPSNELCQKCSLNKTKGIEGT